MILSRRRYMGKVNNILPSGYTQLEELSVVSGNKYVNTSFVGARNGVYRFVTSVKYYSNSSSDRQLCAANESQPWWDCDKGKFKYSDETRNPITAPNTVVETNTWYDVDATMKANAGSGLFLLFTLNKPNSGLNPLNTYQCQMAIKIWDIYDNGTLVRHLIPCRNPNNEEGMYDTVEGQFHALTSY